MALTAAQICNLARQIAKCPGYTAQSGYFLNTILQELCQTYDFEVIRKTYSFNFDTSAGPAYGKAAGSGPNLLPSDYLRAKNNEAIYVIQGVQYVMINVEQDEFDALVQTTGLNNYPTLFYVDMSQDDLASPGLYCWMPASGAYPVTIKYYPLMPDITTPETSTDVPWFPNTNYLIRRLAGELMTITNDDRAMQFLGDDEDATPLGAGVILRKYLTMQNDPEGRVKTVALDRRLFGHSRLGLPNTKQVGW